LFVESEEKKFKKVGLNRSEFIKIIFEPIQHINQTSGGFAAKNNNIKVLNSNSDLTKQEPKPSGKLSLHHHRPTSNPPQLRRDKDLGRTNLESYSTYSRNLIPATPAEDKKLNNNIFLKRAIYNFIKASANNKVSGVYFQDSTALITFLREFDPDFKMSRQSIYNYRKRKVVFKGFLMNSDVSRFFTYIKSRFPEFNPSAFLEKCSGTCSPKPNKAGEAGLLKLYRSCLN
jgi:hypothetical protein